MSFVMAIYIYQYNFMSNDFTDFMQTLKNYNLNDYGWSIFSLLNYNLNFNFFISAFIHMGFFISILLSIYLNKNKLEEELYVLLIIIILIFLNPRLKLYDVAFGLIFLNIAINYLKQSSVLKFYVFNIFVIVIFDVDNAFSIASIWIFENVIVSFTTFSNPYMLRLTLVFCCPIDTTLLKFSILIP